MSTDPSVPHGRDREWGGGATICGFSTPSPLSAPGGPPAATPRMDALMRTSRTRLTRFALPASVVVMAAAALLGARPFAQSASNAIVDPKLYQDLHWRSVGPHRGGRSTAASGV